ncbi:sigma-70 family RNA polymerase sigma factor [Wolbachia endosymbiont (group B) of Melanostoma mellinum]|uniref:sigma-70 family RNA polymerase sigma factor n=1 Tax=Wolbachia endosymbiont (group B) of Melanostoma mellinum TaxID=2954030 RepID=UPI0022306D86|nr:sigma-70 family RNA polymerase sigma factor [Wolbachia endosymbiont (group B) of Melanostoma mellinum]
MKLKNIAIIVKNVKYQAYRLKLAKCFIDENNEDLEQELFCEIWPCLDQYDEDKSSFNTFVARLTENKAINMLKKQQCAKRNINNYISIDVTDLFEGEITKRIDVDYMISVLPKEWQNICEQLKFFNLHEVAKMNNVSRTTLNNIIKKIRAKLSPIYYEGKKKN